LFCRFCVHPPLGLTLFVILVATQAWIFSTTSYSFHAQEGQGSRTEHSLGIGQPLSFIQEDGQQRVEVAWLPLLINGLITYPTSILLAALLSRATQAKRPMQLYGSIAIVMVLASFVISILFSRIYWGYFFKRPDVLKEIERVNSVESIIPLRTEVLADGTRIMRVDESYSIEQRLSYLSEAPYHNLEQRLLTALLEKKLLPEELSLHPPKTLDLFQLIRSTGMLASAEEGYEDADQLQGILIQTSSPQDEELFFIAVRGMQVSNDHYPYYELAFSGRPESDTPKLLNQNRFFMTSQE